MKLRHGRFDISATDTMTAIRHHKARRVFVTERSDTALDVDNSASDVRDTSARSLPPTVATASAAAPTTDERFIIDSLRALLLYGSPN